MLHVDDLLDAYDAAIEKIDLAAGQVYNIGGGPENVMSVWAEFGPMLEKLFGEGNPGGSRRLASGRSKGVLRRHSQGGARVGLEAEDRGGAGGGEVVRVGEGE